MYEVEQKGLRSSCSSCTILPLASEHGASWGTKELARQLWPATLASSSSTRRMLMVHLL
jgi:hypothetical protein